jgi:hypothetical protein
MKKKRAMSLDLMLPVNNWSYPTITRRCPHCCAIVGNLKAATHETNGVTWHFVTCSFCLARGSMSTVTCEIKGARSRREAKAMAHRIGVAEAVWDWNHPSTPKVWDDQEEASRWYAKRCKYVKKYAEGGKP